MARFTTKPEDFTKIKVKNKIITVIKKETFDSFNESILGLGKIQTKSTPINALSVLFDLEGFTNFCKQIDPQLAVPEYLNDFLKWLFEQVRKELIAKTYPRGYITYSCLPLLSKFMGDGILFIWNTENLNETEILNIVLSMKIICVNYETEFYKKIVKKIISPPTKLRCGIARGTVYSVGNGNDFIGPCINMSARLQKLNSLSFCFSRRGLNPKINPSLNKQITTRKTDIRGIGADELVCVLTKEYEKLSKQDKEKFSEA